MNITKSFISNIKKRAKILQNELGVKPGSTHVIYAEIPNISGYNFLK